jgi:DNA-directed RNA polymerase I and III subunit RPAC2
MEAVSVSNKLEIFINNTKGGDDYDNEYSRTFSINCEDHTLANSLRYMLMKNPKVLFCGYTQPHPSEFKVNFKIQTDKQVTALEALEKGLNDLNQVCAHALSVFDEALESFYKK